MHQLTWTSDAIIFVLVVVAVCASLLVAWWRFPNKNQPSLTRWRQLVLRFGLIGNTLSIALLCSFLILALLAEYGAMGIRFSLVDRHQFCHCAARRVRTRCVGFPGDG